jgi:hypothetical protein
MSSGDREVEEITRELEQIRLGQAALTRRQATLTRRLSDIAKKATNNPRLTRDPNRAFAIGDRVHIKNANESQANSGKITRIGSYKITVTTDTGEKITRIPRNLAHTEDE